MPQPRSVRHPRRLVIKFHDGSLVNDQPQPSFLTFFAQLRGSHPELGVLHELFDRNRWGQIHDEQKGALAADLSYRPVDFRTYWRALLGATVPAQSVILAVRSRREVAVAYLDPAGTGPADPDFGVLTHFDHAPQGIALPAAWGVGVAGAYGQGVQLADLERGWGADHAEFGGRIVVDPLSGLPLTGFGVAQTVSEDQEHGCNVLGILMAQEDGAYIQGAAPQFGELRLYSYVDASGSENLADAVMTAALDLNWGDVLLLEVQSTDDAAFPLFENRPAEIAPAVFDAIRLASALGITVVEAAGNDAADLDLSPSGGGVWRIFDVDDPDFEDSGALLVAASKRLYAGTLKRLSASNYGKRVNLFAVGENVSTTSLEPGGFTMISGTSAAAAVIAGAATVVQGAAAELGGLRYSPAALRWMLADGAYATQSHDPVADRMGSMPDLGAIFAGETLPKVPDVFLRDHVGDVGLPHLGSLSSSPDLILRQTKSTDPEADFGIASGLLDDPSIHQDAIAGATHWIYVRCFERQGSEANDVKVAVWWSKPATLIHPADWVWIGEAVIARIPGSGVAVSAGLEWNSAPAAGHYCFLAIAAHPADPPPVLPDFGAISAAGYDAWEAFKSFLRLHNNATWRNFNVLSAASVATASTRGEQSFLVRGAPDRERRMRLALRFLGGSGASVRVHLPESLYAAVETPSLPEGAKRTMLGYEVELFAGSELTLALSLPARSEHECLLRWSLTGSAARGAEFCAIQSEQLDKVRGGGTEELGRVTWIWREQTVPSRSPKSEQREIVVPERSGRVPSVRPARPADRSEIVALLRASGLAADVMADASEFMIAELSGRVAGCAAAELHGKDALLRSVAAVPELRASGIGSQLAEAALARASARGAQRAWMLTETSQRFFGRRGFQEQSRETAPEWLRGHTQWNSRCSSVATVMRREQASPTALFVYGTLRSGSSVPAARRLHAAARSLGTAFVSGALCRLGPFPGLVEAEQGEVEGELFRFPEALDARERLLQELDAYERVGPEPGAELPFRREVRVARRSDGSREACWVYVWRGARER